jgi:putative ABC transport system permease protein
MNALGSSRLRPSDALREGASGLRTSRLRVALSALGVAIGVASTVAVLGISASSKSDLIATLDRLGTNLLTVSPGQTVFGEPIRLPATAPAMIRHTPGVESVAAVEALDQVTVRRSDFVPEGETGAIRVAAADPQALHTLRGRLAGGTFIDGATSQLPVVVLGAVAAERLGIDSIGVSVWLGNQWYSVVGVLQPIVLDPTIDRSALIGFANAREQFQAVGSATTVYVRARTDRVLQVSGRLGRAANPEHPEAVSITRPTDALAARTAVQSTFTALFLGLGAVALLVGGIGIANLMVIAVMERRSEIGLRRALGATKRHIGVQFLLESLLLAVLGGLLGALLGAATTTAYAWARGWFVIMPPFVLAGGLVTAALIGAVAGIYPALHAARLSPTEALRTA